MKYTRDNKRLTSSFISPNSVSLRNVVGAAVANGNQFKYINPCFRVKFRGLTLQKDANINHILNERLQRRCSLIKTTVSHNKGKGMCLNEIILSPKNISTAVSSSVRNNFMKHNEYERLCNPLVEKYGVDSVFYLKYKMKRSLSGLIVNTVTKSEEVMKRTYSSGWGRWDKTKMNNEKTFVMHNNNMNNIKSVNSSSIQIQRKDVLSSGCGCGGGGGSSKIKIYKRRPKSFYAFGRSYKEQFHKKYNAIKNEYIKSKL